MMCGFAIPVLGFILLGQTSSAADKPGMLLEREIVRRSERHYVAIRKQIPMEAQNSTIPSVVVEVFRWLNANGIKHAGAPFTLYLVIDMPKKLEIEIGVPVAHAVSGKGEVRSGSFPAGRYVTATFFGKYGDLERANVAIRAWARVRKSVKLDRKDTPNGIAWGAWFESYLTDPSREPDSSKRRTDIFYLVEK